jgi:glycerol kinase
MTCHPLQVGRRQHIVYLLAKHLRNDYDITVAYALRGELIWKLQGPALLSGAFLQTLDDRLWYITN